MPTASLMTSAMPLPRGAAADAAPAGDLRALQALRSRAAADPAAAAKAAAQQFEALFMGEMLKSMRAASEASTGGAGMLENAGTRLGTEMLDQQLSTRLGSQPGGLSEVILKQLERQMGLAPGPVPATVTANDTPAPLSAQPAPTRVPQTGAAGFVQQHMDAARRAEASTGIPATFMVSQAALETGWGRREIRHADGSPSHNLFGIKAGGSWKGPVAEITTTEYVGGRAQRTTAKFRAYGSYAESFEDYARLMQDSPRYQAVVDGSRRGRSGSAVGAGGGGIDGGARFAQNLQRAGYATDPAYADKLTKVINTTLRLQRTLA